MTSCAGGAKSSASTTGATTRSSGFVQSVLPASRQAIPRDTARDWEVSRETILACLTVLQQKATEHDAIDYLQVFESADGDRLWFIENGRGGAITALLPDEY